MDCNEARLLLDARLDRELSAEQAYRVEQHVATCPGCRDEAQALLAVSQAARASEYFRAPDALRSRIIAMLPDAEPISEPARAATAETEDARGPFDASPAPTETASPEARAKTRKPRILGWAWDAWRTPRGARTGTGGLPPVAGAAVAFGWPLGIAVAAAALVASVALVVHRPGNAGAPLVDELVASHVRAQLSRHDIDVVSSDQHTVKPWFNGRIDYAPPVEDLAEDGFALTGGRLDYIEHRRVAVLVYRYRKHIIDVYVMPDTGTNVRAASAALANDGYALASWHDHGMIWWAVSDAEPAVLGQLRTALTARLAR